VDKPVSDAGRSFGVAADAYDRARPGWPAELLDALPLESAATVVDLGAGTGILTRLLARRFARVIAIEPDDAMRALIEVGEPVAGVAESVPLPDASVDGILSAEAFHWFDAERALAEIARVLKPGGVLALLWNRFDPGDDVLAKGVMPEPTSPKHTLFGSDEWRIAFERAPFAPLRDLSVAQERSIPRAELLDYFSSVSPVTALPDHERELMLARIASALDRPAYRRRWTTVMYWTTLETLDAPRSAVPADR
jgi:SAM-dependent methyltransferase